MIVSGCFKVFLRYRSAKDLHSEQFSYATHTPANLGAQLT